MICFAPIVMQKFIILNSLLKMFKKLSTVPPTGNGGMSRGLIQGTLKLAEAGMTTLSQVRRKVITVTGKVQRLKGEETDQ